jgi:hypothetical protein
MKLLNGGGTDTVVASEYYHAIIACQPCD